MTTTASEPGRPQRADARRNRERILESARTVFAQYGAEAQMEHVAREAGVGVGTVYRHFPTKDALMVELVRQKLLMLGDSTGAALELDGEPFEVFAGLLRRNAELAARDAAIQHALMAAGEHIWRQAEPEHEELSRRTGILMERAQRAGTMRPDVGPADIQMLMCGVSATMARSGAGFDWRRHLELVIDSLRRR